MQTELLTRVIEDHRRRWPVQRIAADTDRYSAECALILSDVLLAVTPDEPAFPDAFWTALMFGDPPAGA